MSRPASTAELLERAVRRGLVEAHVSLPAEVVAVDLAKNLVDVQPRLRKPIATASGELGGEALPLIRNVPIEFPGAGGFRFTFPVAVGDPCLLVFADYSLEAWKGEGAEVDPMDVRAHHLADAVALFGVRPVSRAVTAPADAATIGHEEGLQIAMKKGGIELGGADQAVALGDAIASYLASLKTWLDALILPSAAGPAGPPAVPSPTVPDVTSSAVKVKE